LKEKLGRLKLLQAVDQVLDGLQQQREGLPREVESIEKERDEIQAAFDRLKQEVEELQATKKRRELDQTEENDRVKKYDARLKELKTNREYQALLREIGFAKKAATELSEEIQRLTGELAAKEEEFATTKAALQEKNDIIAGKRKDVDKALKEVEKSYAAEEKRRDELLAEIPKDLLSRYKLVRKRTNLVVVNAKNGACQGCFMSLPPQLFNQIRRNDTLYTCPNCHRILTYEAPEAVKA
jgi:predicted  nucleic acid-binding Zn-ribbon protein